VLTAIGAGVSTSVGVGAGVPVAAGVRVAVAEADCAGWTARKGKTRRHYGPSPRTWGKPPQRFIQYLYVKFCLKSLIQVGENLWTIIAGLPHLPF